jgi:hypothetical protein
LRRCAALREISSNPGLEDVERQQDTLHPGWSNGRVQGCQQHLLREYDDLLEGASLDQLGQDGSGSAAEDTTIPAEPDHSNGLIHTDVQLHPEAVSTQRIDLFVSHVGRWESTIITRMAKMLENGLTIQ